MKHWRAASVVACAPYRVSQLAGLLGADHVIPAMPDHLDTEENCHRELQAIGVFQFDAVVVTSSALSVEFGAKYSDRVATTVKEVADDSGWFSWLRRGKEAANKKRLDYSQLGQLSSLVDGGELQPVLDVSYPVERFDEALERIAGEDAAQQAVGKVVLRFT